MAEVWQASIVDGAGNIIPRAVVQVRDESTGELAEIFDDVDGEIPKRNPFFADDTGFARFYAEPGLYRIRARRGAQDRTYENVMLGTVVADYYVWQHQVTDSHGNALAYAVVEIRDAGTNALATLYADDGGSVSLANPCQADVDGVARCYVAAGVYRIAITSGVTLSRTLEDVVIGPAPSRDLYAWQSVIVDDTGESQSGASILVTDQETGEPVTIYADDEATPLTNPFQSDVDGDAKFYAEAGVYCIRARSRCEQRIMDGVRLGRLPAPIVIALVRIGVGGGAVRSLDEGESWEPLESIPASSFWNGIAYSPVAKAWVALAGPSAPRLLRSTDGGESWTDILSTLPTLPASVGIHELLWSARLGKFVIVAARQTGGSVGGAYLITSTDGLSWSLGAKSPTAISPRDAVDFAAASRIIVGTPTTNGYATEDGSLWSQISTSSGVFGEAGAAGPSAVLWSTQELMRAATDDLNFAQIDSGPGAAIWSTAGNCWLVFGTDVVRKTTDPLGSEGWGDATPYPDENFQAINSIAGGRLELPSGRILVCDRFYTDDAATTWSSATGSVFDQNTGRMAYGYGGSES